jgi:hypothetical protein
MIPGKQKGGNPGSNRIGYNSGMARSRLKAPVVTLGGVVLGHFAIVAFGHHGDLFCPRKPEIPACGSGEAPQPPPKEALTLPSSSTATVNIVFGPALSTAAGTGVRVDLKARSLEVGPPTIGTPPLAVT